MKKQAIYFIALVLSVMLAGCHDLAELAHGPEPVYIPVTHVIINKENYKTYTWIDGMETIIAEVFPLNATNRDVEWESADRSVVDIDNNGLIIGRKVGVTFVKVTTIDGKRTASCFVNVSKDQVSVTGVSVNNTSANLPVNSMEIVTPVITPDNATNQVVGWTSNNEKVATVSQSGVVTTKAAGSATITVTTADNSFTDYFVVNVGGVTTSTVAVTGVSVDKTASIDVGKTETLSAAVTPPNATNQKVLWSSSNPAIATVSPSGMVVGVAAGTVVITVTTVEGGRSAECEVTVNSVSGPSVAVSSVSLNKTFISLVGGEKETLKATVIPSNANQNVTWTSSNSRIASVSENGEVTAGAVAGDAVITARSVITAEGSQTATCTVRVTSTAQTPVADDFNIIGTGSYTHTGSIFIVIINAKPEKSTGIITVLYNGSATAPSAVGSYTVTFNVATASGWSAAQGLVAGTLTINAAIYPVTGVTLNKNTATITVGGKETLIATVAPANATNKSVSWRSSDETVATVSSSGEVTAVSAGTATITVATADGNRTAICVVTVTTNKFPVAEDYIIEELSQVHTGSPCPVIIKPKDGKSTGAVTIYYGNSTTAPTAIGNYAITFDVATASGWFAATGLSGGRLYITAAYVAVTSVTLNKNTATITVGGKETLTATVAPASATVKGVDWSSSDEDIATVSSSGEVTAVSAGTAIITATSDDDSSKTAKCTVTVNPPPTAVTFMSVTSDGNSTQTSTFIILTFSAQITGLSAEDITLSGVSGVIKGMLSGSYYSYTLPISGFTASGTLTVAVTKSGYTISGSPQSVGIYYAVPPITPDGLASHLASLLPNTASTPHNITLKVTSTSEFTTIRSALQGATNKYVYLDLTGSTISTIPNNAINNCTSLISIIIPDGVTSIEYQAFGYCKNLTSITLGNNITSIGNDAFRECTSLTSITIPNSVTNIEFRAFGSCTSLATINVGSGNNAYTSENGILYNKSKTILHTYPGGKPEHNFTIPNSVIDIWDSAFFGCNKLKTITMPDSVISIGRVAFGDCRELNSVTIGSNVTSIGESAFSFTDVNIIIIPSSINSIGKGAFNNYIYKVTFQGTLPSSGFFSGPGVYDTSPFPGDLRDKFYATDSTLGTPGTYLRSGSSWTLQP